MFYHQHVMDSSNTPSELLASSMAGEPFLLPTYFSRISGNRTHVSVYSRQELKLIQSLPLEGFGGILAKYRIDTPRWGILGPPQEETSFSGDHELKCHRIFFIFGIRRIL